MTDSNHFSHLTTVLVFPSILFLSMLFICHHTLHAQREATLSELFLAAYRKGSTVKGKNLLPPGANSFLLE